MAASYGPLAGAYSCQPLILTLLILFVLEAKPNLPSAAAITMSPCCPPDWVMNQGNCYHAPEAEGGWDAGQHYCSSLGASLAVIENIEKLVREGSAPHLTWLQVQLISDFSFVTL